MSEQPSITCPRCGMKSYNANDITEGYCGHCHDWTNPALTKTCDHPRANLVFHPGVDAMTCGKCGVTLHA